MTEKKPAAILSRAANNSRMRLLLAALLTLLLVPVAAAAGPACSADADCRSWAKSQPSPLNIAPPSDWLCEKQPDGTASCNNGAEGSFWQFSSCSRNQAVYTAIVATTCAQYTTVRGTTQCAQWNTVPAPSGDSYTTPQADPQCVACQSNADCAVLGPSWACASGSCEAIATALGQPAPAADAPLLAGILVVAVILVLLTIFFGRR